MNSSFPGYKVPYVIIIFQINFNIFSHITLSHLFSGHRQLRIHNFLRFLNVTEAIIQMLNNCINVILDSSIAKQTKIVVPFFQGMRVHRLPDNDVTLEKCVFISLFYPSIPLNIILHHFFFALDIFIFHLMPACLFSWEQVRMMIITCITHIYA